MEILCDTCSILMLLRIAPQMFLDDTYQCCTIAEVRNEIFQTQKFKNKYPWREKFKDKIKPFAFSAYCFADTQRIFCRYSEGKVGKPVDNSVF